MAKTKPKPRFGPNGERLKQINYRVPEALVEEFEQLLRDITKRFGLKTTKAYLFAEVLRLGIGRKRARLDKFEKANDDKG